GWAYRGGTRGPLTRGLLAEAGLALSDVEWRGQVGNHKAFRRTGMAADRIDAATEWFGDHGVMPLEGRCANFLRGKTLPFGDVQFIRPTKEFPEIRLRFTPAKGLIYGGNDSRTRPEDVADVVYDTGGATWSGCPDDNANRHVIRTDPRPLDGAVGHSR